jgi:hypothetical protein
MSKWKTLHPSPRSGLIGLRAIAWQHRAPSTTLISASEALTGFMREFQRRTAGLPRPEAGRSRNAHKSLMTPSVVRDSLVIMTPWIPSSQEDLQRVPPEGPVSWTSKPVPIGRAPRVQIHITPFQVRPTSNCAHGRRRRGCNCQHRGPLPPPELTRTGVAPPRAVSLGPALLSGWPTPEPVFKVFDVAAQS